jgi:serine/threonine protein kinase
VTTSPPPDLSGITVAGRYEVETLLGQGGMGSVWKGRHLTLNNPVAIKFLHPKLTRSAEARRRFENEGKAAARISSRHAVKVHDYGVADNGYPFIVMEYLEGQTLEQVIKKTGPRLIDEVTAIITQVARALEAAHDAGIVHRDLKPDNIFLAKDAEAGQLGYTVKVVDFGIAKLVHEDTSATGGGTQAGTVLGTPHYMSPEALTGSSPVTGASDIWSLGSSAFAALCGRPPFQGDVLGEVVLKVCSAPLPTPSRVNSSVPREFDVWFQKACARLPQNRFATAREAAVALQNLDQWVASMREQSSFEVRPIQPSVLELDLPVNTSKRTKILAGMLATAALAIGGVGLYTAHLARETNELMSQPLPTASTPVPVMEDASPVATDANPDAGTDASTDAKSEAATARSASTPASSPPR